jgi:hypothetical protein
LFGPVGLDDVLGLVLADPGRAGTTLVELLELRYRVLP